MYAARRITPNTTVVLRPLGHPSVAGYDRSWTEWGNRDDLPAAR